MDFLDKPISDLSLAELQRLIRQEVGHQIPPIPAWVANLSDLDQPLIPPDVRTNNYTLVYNTAAGQYQNAALPSSSTGTDGITPTIGTVTVGPGPGFLRASWAAAGASADPMMYKVYIRANSAPTTSDATYLIGTTTALSLVMNTLADGTTQIQFGTTYHVKVIAVSMLSGGGTSAASVDQTGTPAAIDGVVTTFTNIAAGTITAGDIGAARMTANFLTAAQATITTLSSIVANIGTITSGTIQGTTIQTAAVNNARMVLDSTSLRSLDASNATIWAISATTGIMTTGNLASVSVDLGAITAGSFTLASSASTSFIRTAASGQRVVMDSGGLHLYDTSGNIIVELSTDSTAGVVGYFSGTVAATNFTTSQGTFTGLTNQIAGGSALLLAAGVSAPLNAPGLALSAGGSLAASTAYYVSWSWCTNNELRFVNQCGFETDATTGITKVVGTETVTVDATATNFNSGLQALKVVTAATAGSGIRLGSAASAVANDHYVTAGVTYTFSCYLKETAGGSQLKLQILWKDGSGTVLQTDTGTATSITTSFVRYSYSGAGVAPAGAVYATLAVIINAATVSTFWVDDCQFEAAASAGTLVQPYETQIHSAATLITTTVPNKTIAVTLPAAPDATATRAKLYLGTTTFNTGGASGHFQKSVAVTTTATTLTSLSTNVSTSGVSLATGTYLTTTGSGVIRPVQATDGTDLQGWSLEGNGRIRFLGPTMNTQAWIYDDFVYTATAWGATNTQTYIWTIVFSGTGANIQNGSTSASNFGTVNLTTGTQAVGQAFARTSTTIYTEGVGRARFSAYWAVNAAPDATNSYNITVGLTDQTTAANIANADHAIAFRCSVNNGAGFVELIAVDNTGASAKTTTSVAIAANTFYFTEFEIDAARTVIKSWVNFVRQTDITTHITGTNTAMCVKLAIDKIGSTTARILSVDAVSFFVDYVTG